MRNSYLCGNASHGMLIELFDQSRDCLKDFVIYESNFEYKWISLPFNGARLERCEEFLLVLGWAKQQIVSPEGHVGVTDRVPKMIRLKELRSLAIVKHRAEHLYELFVDCSKVFLPVSNSEFAVLRWNTLGSAHKIVDEMRIAIEENELHHLALKPKDHHENNTSSPQVLIRFLHKTLAGT